MMWWCRAFVAAVVGACASVGVSLAQDGVSSFRSYAVGPGDSIVVDAFQHSDISGEFQVEGSGDITYPLLGSVPVAGKTTQQISALLEELLEKDYYVDVQLQVEVKEYRSQQVSVLGEVQRPGTYYLEGRTSLTRLLSEAGGLRSTAGQRLELRRTVIVDGEATQRVHTYSTEKLLRGEEGSDVDVVQGDVISVPGKQLYFVSGEVERPGQYEITHGMTVMQAISQAGGLAKFASQTVELRREADGEKALLMLDLSDIRKNKQDDPVVEPGDTIIVRKRFF